MTTIWTYTCSACDRVWRMRPPIIDQDGAHRDRVNEPCSGEIKAEPVSLARAPHVLAPRPPITSLPSGRSSYVTTRTGRPTS
jgi:hypothetical protein